MSSSGLGLRPSDQRRPVLSLIGLAGACRRGRRPDAGTASSEQCVERSYLVRFSAGVEADGGAAGGVEKTAEPERVAPGVCEAVRLPPREVQTRAGGNGRRLFARPEASAATENADDFLVLVKVVGRAARGNEADELSHRLAPGLRVHENSEPAAVG